MKAYFEYQDEPYSELKKFYIYFKDGYYYAEQIEPPCNDRRLSWAVIDHTALFL